MAIALSMKDLCERYRCAESTIYEWRKKGLLPKARKIGRKNGFDLTELEASDRIHRGAAHFSETPEDEEERLDANDSEKWRKIRGNARRAAKKKRR